MSIFCLSEKVHALLQKRFYSKLTSKGKWQLCAAFWILLFMGPISKVYKQLAEYFVILFTCTQWVLPYESK